MHSRIQVVVLAAGEGRRLRPLTANTPKALLSVGGKPIIEHTLDTISSIAHEIVLIIGYHGEKIWKHIGDEYRGTPVRYIEQRELGGTAHALQQAKHALDKRFLVMMGDDLYAREDIEQLTEHPWAVLAKEVSAPEKYGVVRKDRFGNLKDIIENPKNPPSKLVNCGAYVMGEEYFQHEPVRIPNGEIGLPQTLVSVARAGTPIRVIKASFWHPIGYPADFKRAEKIVKKSPEW